MRGFINKTLVWGWLVAIFSASPLTSACGLLDPLYDEVTIKVEEPAVAYDASTKFVRMVLPISIRNTGATSVTYLPCNRLLLRRRDGDWHRVWLSLCEAGDASDWEILVKPGGQVSDTIRISGTLGYGSVREWTEPVEGKYQVWIGLFTDVREVKESARLSRPFTITPR